MFCNETIEKVYLGQPEYHDEGNYFLDCYYDMTVHLCGQYRLILETASFFLSLESSGVIKLDKTGPIDSIAHDGEWIDPCIHVDEGFDDAWVDYESTLFVGERLLSVTEIDSGYLLTFDDFELKLLPHLTDNDFPYYPPHSYSRVYGTERLIKKCSCGGTGELILDFVSDYGIRCNKCHRGTSANPCACDAIDEWNSIDELPQIGDYPEEQFKNLCHEPVEYIVIERFYQELENDALCCRSIIAKFGEQKFVISSRYAGRRKNDFCFETCTSFNPEIWPQKISAVKNGPISLIEKGCPSGQVPLLIFRVGEHTLTISAENANLVISPIKGLLEKAK